MRHVIGGPLKTLASISWVVFGIWAFILELAIVNQVAGFWGVVVAFALAPVTFVAAPWYAGIAWGVWTPLVVGYGGPIVGGILFWVGSTISGD